MKIGDLVTRNSYNNDIVFVIKDIKENIAYLVGKEDRLLADSPISDLVPATRVTKFEPESDFSNLNRDEFFYMPAKILHIDGDEEYLKKSMEYYKKCGIKAVGKQISESKMPDEIEDILISVKPDILIITGHDAHFNKKKDGGYKNSKYFIEAVKKARNYESSHEKLVIIAGACQSDYENLLISGANFASSPKRVNIHALDPSIIAVNIALTSKTDSIDIKRLLSKTKYGADGIGGLVSNGMMYVGYPR